ncbi:MAG: hypothetical protein ACT4PG_02765 [Panacagrimonas sp.]
MKLLGAMNTVIAEGADIRLEGDRWTIDGRYVLDNGYQLLPQVVTMAQARLALLAAGHLSSVQPILDGLPEPQRSAAVIEWEYRGDVGRASALVAHVAAQLELSEADVDALFIAAAAM